MIQYIGNAFSRKITVTGLLISAFSINSYGQKDYNGLEHLFTPPLNYVVTHTKETITADGTLSEEAWANAKWTTDFVDIEGAIKPLPHHKTQVKMLWNDSTLFIAAKLQEPQIWATLKNHDDIIYHDNDFEVFIDPYNTTHHYFEIEVNAFNKIFDLFMNKPYRNGGDALMSWDARGLRTGVEIKGTLNNPGDTDKEWTVEMAIPFKSIAFGMDSQVAQDGSLWRVNFSRVQYDTHVTQNKIVKDKGKNGRNLPERNWVWSPQGVVNMHFPERWGYLLFAKDPNQTFVLPIEEKQKQLLWLIYYRQKEYFQKSKKYTSNLSELGISEATIDKEKVKAFKLGATSQLFNASFTTLKNKTISINQEGLITVK